MSDDNRGTMAERTGGLRTFEKNTTHATKSLSSL